MTKTCKYLCICQAACLPSLVLSTVVLATPATSPPQNTPGSLLLMVSGSTSGKPHLLNFSGAKALITRKQETVLCHFLK